MAISEAFIQIFWHKPNYIYISTIPPGVFLIKRKSRNTTVPVSQSQFSYCGCGDWLWNPLDTVPFIYPYQGPYPIKIVHLYPIYIPLNPIYIPSKSPLKNYHQVTLLKSPVKFITITTVKRPSIRGRYATLQPLRSHLRVQAMLKDIYAWHHRAQNVDDGLLMDRAVPGSDTIKKKLAAKSTPWLIGKLMKMDISVEKSWKLRCQVKFHAQIMLEIAKKGW